MAPCAVCVRCSKADTTHRLTETTVPETVDPSPPPSGASPMSASTRKRSMTIPMKIARVETVTMTPDELDVAGKALGVLLVDYWRQNPDRS